MNRQYLNLYTICVLVFLFNMMVGGTRNNPGLHGEVQRRYNYMELRRTRRPGYYHKTSRHYPRNPYGDDADVDENYYEPYMPGGQWAFTREIPGLLYTWTTVSVGTTTKGNWMNWWTSPSPTPTKRMFDTAHRYCPMIYELFCAAVLLFLNVRSYGRVCARRVIRYLNVYEYKEFNNLCEMQDYNYKDRTKTWFPVHKGYCSYNYTWDYQLTDPNWIMNRASSLEWYAEHGTPLTVPPSTRLYPMRYPTRKHIVLPKSHEAN